MFYNLLFTAMLSNDDKFCKCQIVYCILMSSALNLYIIWSRSNQRAERTTANAGARAD